MKDGRLNRNSDGIDHTIRENFDFAAHVARVLTKVDKNHVHLFIEPGTGSGMAHAGIQSAETLAKVMSFKKYGTIDRWKEFFDEKKDIIDGNKLKLMDDLPSRKKCLKAVNVKEV
jgi:hypothetical protein